MPALGRAPTISNRLTEPQTNCSGFYGTCCILRFPPSRNFALLQCAPNRSVFFLQLRLSDLPVGIHGRSHPTGTMLATAAAMPDFWAKTCYGDQPGISVRDHCVNVGCVAEALLERGGVTLRTLLPAGSVSMAALHDIGKISTGFQAKCPAWLVQAGLAEAAARERWREGSESDHAKVSQYFLEGVMKPTGTRLWAVAAGVHHGRIFGKRVGSINVVPEREAWETAAREQLLAHLVSIFGPLPPEPPQEHLAELWCVAGLISVADWIGSNEIFFPSERGLTLDESRKAAARALDQIHWQGGAVRSRTFGELFGGYAPVPLQTALHTQCGSSGLFIVEGPMGCGKTEAALWAAHRLIESGANDGMYFALPTQVTSNRIHLRVAPFLQHDQQ